MLGYALTLYRLMLVLLFSVYQYNEQRKRIQSPVTDYSLNLLWKTGLEKLNENSIIESHLKPCLKYPLHNGEYAQCAHKYGGAYAMILAGLPKLCVSAIYLSLNNQLTLMVQLRDWARLASRRQALRVSTPEPASDQVSTYWLSLPYQYSIPLLLSSVSLSWLVSQTLCMLRFHTYDDIRINEVPDVDHQMGFSGIALIGFLIFGTIIFGLSVAIGFCKCSPGLPIGPSNSLIIAAACHPPERDRYAARKMVKWGAIPNGNNEDDANSTHHCTITSRRVEDPVEGRWYG